MRLLFYFLFFLFGTVSYAQTMRISVFTEGNIKSISIQPSTGSYFCLTDTGFVQKIQTADILTISVGISNKIDVKLNNVFLLSTTKFLLMQEKVENVLVLNPISPNLKERSYEGDFEITSKKSRLQLINIVDIDQYLEGVVESESGTGQNLEYYKAQTIISRTYALKYREKHADGGYNLCDRVHCQAYLHKRLTAALIDSAVRQTKNIIMLDDDNKLYSTYFHANCGGQTCEPDIIWNEQIDGFSSFRDTFCIKTKQAKWEKRIPLSEWTAFMVNKYDFPIWDSVSNYQLTHYQQESRQAFFIHPFYGIPLRDLREAFQLKSTFFSCSLDGEYVVINGRGFGHGVGLCQEGAMIMSKKGYDHKQILLFYYPKMHLNYVTPQFRKL